MGATQDFHRSRLTGTGTGAGDPTHPLHHLRTAPLTNRPRTRSRVSLPGATLLPGRRRHVRRVPSGFWWGSLTGAAVVAAALVLVPLLG